MFIRILMHRKILPPKQPLFISIVYLPTRMWHVIKQPGCERHMARGNILKAVIVRSLHFCMKAKPNASQPTSCNVATRDARVALEPRGIDENPTNGGWLLEAMRTTDVPAITFFSAIPTDFRSIPRGRV